MARQAGFSILELLTALAVMGLGLLGILRLVSSATAAAGGLRIRQQALLLAQGTLEAAREGALPPRRWTDREGRPCGQAQGFFRLEVRVVTGDPGGMAGLALLEARVAWRQGPSGQEGSLALRGLGTGRP